jgi:hypothetical protein
VGSHFFDLWPQQPVHDEILLFFSQKGTLRTIQIKTELLLTMMRLLSSLLPSLLLVGLLATGVQGRLLRRRGSPASTPGISTRCPPVSALGFYESRPDARECPSPICGGAFVRPIDGSLITCPGASELTAECYVAAMRYPPQQLSTMRDGGGGLPTPGQPGTSIVYGRMIPGDYLVPNVYYDFEVHDGTKAAASLQIPLDYTVKRDYRKCVSPLCGGFWLKAMATTKTLCSDASVADACYVASLNLSGLNPTTPTVVDGSSVKGYYIGNPDYQNTGLPDLKDLYILEVSGPLL